MATEKAEKVLIYTKPGCPYCLAALKDLDEKGTPYEEISTADNPEALAEVKRLSDGKGIVPVVVRGDEVTVGFGGG